MPKVLSFRAARIDRYGDLCRLINQARFLLDPLEKERKSLEFEIRAWFDKQPPEHVETVRGKLYAITVGARRLKRTVDKAAAIAKLGLERFAEHASIALGILDNLIPSDERAGIIATELSGDRSISDPMPLAPPARAVRKAVA